MVWGMASSRRSSDGVGLARHLCRRSRQPSSSFLLPASSSRELPPGTAAIGNSRRASSVLPPSPSDVPSRGVGISIPPPRAFPKPLQQQMMPSAFAQLLAVEPAVADSVYFVQMHFVHLSYLSK